MLNGIELGGGSIRIHDAAQQEHVFKDILKVCMGTETGCYHVIHIKCVSFYTDVHVSCKQ